MFFSKQKSVIGIDIGTSNIKIAQVTHAASGPVLDTYGIVGLAGHVDPKNGEVALRQTADILKDLLAQANTTTKRAVVSLPNSAVFTSIIDMPKMTETELESAMQFEAKKYIPLPFSEVALSWSIVSENAGLNTLKVLLIAVPKQVRERYVNVCIAAGLDLEIIEIEALALIRALVADPRKNSVIIDIGAKNTGINIIRSGLLQLTRNVNVGGDTITDRIASTLNISQNRAEQFKKDFGLSQSEFIPESVKPVLNVIKNEVKQLFVLYQTQGITLDSIILAGGGSTLPGIADYFSDLGTTVILGDPLKNISYTQAAAPILKRFSTQLTISIGLALRGDDE